MHFGEATEQVRELWNIVEGTGGKCWKCAGETLWFDLDYGAYICSVECEELLKKSVPNTFQKGEVKDGRNNPQV